MSIVTEINCTTAKDFLDKITPWSSPYQLSNYVFRGHAESTFNLHPNILRKKNNQELLKIAKVYLAKGRHSEVLSKIGLTNLQFYHSSIELTILRKFYKTANENGLFVPNSELMSLRMETGKYISLGVILKLCGHTTWLNKDSIEIAALAQHYGLPTRLIDWSYNQYIASFFASNLINKPNKEKKISLWMLNYKQLNNVFTSPLTDVRIFSPHYQWNENARSQRGLFTYIESKHDKNTSDLLTDFLESYQSTKIISTDSKFDSLYTDYRTFDVALENAINIYNSKKSEQKELEDCLIKITLPQSEAIKLNKYLREIRISESTIFPGYSGVVEDLKSVLRM
ncbi:FRG domain-containing protein [Salmonella enterica]|uniref:FRG domain-containing protein n=1 Tax=Salmonella enterica TaxID=28901 RepID=A0A628V3X1_SALER|nr:MULTISPECIES: FRG domain-containing protein [Enterobacteriaceae]EBE3485705.1 FRG domain-containing protein [Salmonella enterica subsp. enterica serovar Heidelberg]EBG2526102.1 FRG domain-containing protein [Salmonella enterica subsp. enterica serovar Eastbourne]EBG3169503.1 FRG domain-containing protein [Salmonella enterica subsp. enterica serovar Thetford]EBW6529099.1 FRG domain-containing protein [Salmonella enterica subsp. enterica serovar Havana]EBX4895478.1 FRG domain-containing protei